MLTPARCLNAAGDPRPLLALEVHLRAVTDAAQRREDTQAARLCNELGFHLDAVEQYAAARPYCERALAIRERVLGPEHSDTALSLNNLGGLLQAQGDLGGARPYFERALHIFMARLDPNHASAQTGQRNLAAHETLIHQSQSWVDTGTREFWYDKATATVGTASP